MDRLTIRCGNCVGAIKPEDMGTQGILRKLAEYEDLEEQGLLFRLPCKIGSDVFFIPSKANFGLNIFTYSAPPFIFSSESVYNRHTYYCLERTIVFLSALTSLGF